MNAGRMSFTVKTYPKPSGHMARGLGELGIFDRDSWQEITTGARCFHAAAARMSRQYPHMTSDDVKAELWRKLGL